MATYSNSSMPHIPKNQLGNTGLGLGSPAPSLLSLRSVIEAMPTDVRRRYKDTSKYVIWPECPLDGNGNAAEFSQHQKFGGSISSITSLLKRNYTLSNDLSAREYCKFGNSPVVVPPSSLKPPRGRVNSETKYPGFSPFLQRKMKQTAGPSVSYSNSKDGGDIDLKLSPAETTRL